MTSFLEGSFLLSNYWFDERRLDENFDDRVDERCLQRDMMKSFETVLMTNVRRIDEYDIMNSFDDWHDEQLWQLTWWTVLTIDMTVLTIDMMSSLDDWHGEHVDLVLWDKRWTMGHNGRIGFDEQTTV